MQQLPLLRLMIPVLIAALAFPLLSVLLPIVLPFLVGLGLALLSEPAVNQLEKQMKLRRSLSAAIGVTTVLICSAFVLIVVVTFVMRQFGTLSRFLPDVMKAIADGIQLLKQKLLALAGKAPGKLRSTLTSSIERLLTTQLPENALNFLPHAASDLLGHLSHGMLSTVTAVISAYLFSIRLPMLRQKIQALLPPQWQCGEKLRSFRKSMVRWFVAEGKLALVALVILSAGFLMMRLSNALLIAALVTLVDILPILGVGTVLVPWSILCLLQGNTAKGLWLACLFLVIWLVRSILEPKLISKELGLDPLLTLLALYAGLQLAGLWGILLSPVAAIALQQFCKEIKA